MRFRLIPTRGLRGSRFAHGDTTAVLAEAEAMSADHECKVLVVEHPQDGTVREVATVGKNPEKPKRSGVT